MQKDTQQTNKWGSLNYFNKFNIKNYSLTSLFILILFIILYFSFDQNDIFSYTGGIYINILIYILLAVSLNIAVGLMGQLSLGHAGFIAIGGYTAALVSKSMISSGLPEFIQLFISSIAGGIVAAIFGALLGASTLRLRGDYLAIITLAFGEIIKYVIQNLDFLGGATGLKNIPNITNFSNSFVFVVISVIIMTMIMTSRKGREIISIRENEIAAENIGININRVKLYGFALSAFFAGIGGSLFAHNIGILTPDKFGFVFSIEILVMVVFGGLGSITGAIISAIMLTLLNEQLREVSQFRYLVYAIILIVLMIFRSEGLLGTKELTIPRFVRKIRTIKNRALNKK
ncbi:MAG: branched-chain amino acid ABC transporter permease [Leptotrichiaceae bacterium]|nr:branched-chain amino acid ABC transporter permease [Leptotrichiaceae bacterium]MBP6281224.1 branched-chain amino acid ABC transporter permease [Leptotrichiaceae bacterium]MBP7100174.1 branched-chain amino acid ABC transporter permease [Leptotrichiaceae bacterium]MBP7725609.1 branched-chain amino acid ABC transporter permease [Leptotrichiaceae bacterium]MBP9629996.1 branched-chain amino acid ABC transporter permease [Leptotrichiaceae bacterium]